MSESVQSQVYLGSPLIWLHMMYVFICPDGVDMLSGRLHYTTQLVVTYVHCLSIKIP